MERGAAQHVQARGNLGGGGGKCRIGGRRRDDDDVDGVRVHAGIAERARRGLECQIGGRFVVAGDVTDFDPGTLQDPRIARVHHFCQIVIGEDLGWKK